MKTMNLTQQLNPEYMGNHTPTIDNFRYIVTKVTNSVSPEVHDCLTKKQVSRYCHSDDWKVVIS